MIFYSILYFIEISFFLIFLKKNFSLFTHNTHHPLCLSSPLEKAQNVYVCVCVCVFCITYSCLYICPSTFWQNHILHNRFMIWCGWFLDFIENFMLFYMNWYKCNTSLYSGKHCLFPNSYILFFVSYNWKKKRVLCIVLKTWMVKEPKRKVPIPGFLLVLEVLIGPNYSSILSWTCKFSSVWSCF